ncbi:MAG: lysophospholipid acyltransferase family protein [Pseudomonadota bacterium]
MIRWLRSLMFLAFNMTLVIPYATVILLLFWAPRSWPYAVCVNYCSLALWSGRFFCGMKFEVEGYENLPDQPSVIMMKHTSTLETYGHVPLFPRTAWVVKKSILYVPIIGWAMAIALDPIAIDRGAGGRAVKQVIRQGKERLADGVWVTVYPEGTRVKADETRKYGVSGAALAREAGAPIVPVAHNAGDLWQRREFVKRPGTVRFVIGPPIDAAAQSPKETNLIVQNWIESTMHEISTAYQTKDPS